MRKREASFTLKFRHYLKAHPMRSALFELKQTTSSSIPFSSVKEHQIDALLAARSTRGLLYKAPDDSRQSKPADLFYLRDSLAMVVIKFPKFFCFIDVANFITERDSTKRKSLTAKRARDIAERVVEL